MTKQLEKRFTRSQPSRGLSALWLNFVMLVCGYLLASWLDINQLAGYIHSAIHTQPHVKPKDPVKSEELTAHPKLEFYTLLSKEKMMVAPPAPTAVSEDVKPASLRTYEEPAVTAAQPLDLEVTAEKQNPTVKEAQAVSTQPVPKALPSKFQSMPAQSRSRETELSMDAYTVQVGSFRVLQEAQRMKTRLMVTGFKVNIVAVTQQDVHWYRVVIGPFKSLGEARQAQQVFARREHINGMIRKIA